MLTWLLSKRQSKTNVDDNVEERQPLSNIGSNTNKYSHYVKQYSHLSSIINRTTI
jgi:hypothetical protein